MHVLESVVLANVTFIAYAHAAILNTKLDLLQASV